MPRLLIAYDGSQAARSAVRAAAGLFPGAEAIVVFAHDEPPYFERIAVHSGTADPALISEGVAALSSQLTRRATEAADQGAALATEHGLAAEAAIVPAKGGVGGELLDVARAREVDVVVCGTRGRGGVGRALLGSTAMSLLHHADRSVLIVPDGEFTTSGPVMIAYDGSDGAQAAIVTAAGLFPNRSAVVLHMWRSPLRDTISGRLLLEVPVDALRETGNDIEELLMANARAIAKDGADYARQHGLDARDALAERRRNSWWPIVEAADSADACVLVAGSRGRGGFASALLGSTSSALANNAERPTLIVRSAD